MCVSASTGCDDEDGLFDVMDRGACVSDGYRSFCVVNSVEKSAVDRRGR